MDSCSLGLGTLCVRAGVPHSAVHLPISSFSCAGASACARPAKGALSCAVHSMREAGPAPDPQDGPVRASMVWQLLPDPIGPCRCRQAGLTARERVDASEILCMHMALISRGESVRMPGRVCGCMYVHRALARNTHGPFSLLGSSHSRRA
jgi:hypothetical protein